METFTVIMPAYNAAATIEATIQSVIEQSCKSWELIIVDDGSCDDTLDKVRPFTENDDRIYVREQRNLGPSHARNAAIREASGKYIAFLDADDLWHPSRLDVAKAHFEENALTDIVYGVVAFFKDNVEKISAHSSVIERPMQVADMLAENKTCTMSNIVARREVFGLVGGLDVGITHGEDRVWLLKCITSGLSLVGINKTFTYYRVSVGGLSANLEAMDRGWHQSLELALNAGVVLSRTQIAEARAVFCRYLARRALRTGASSLKAVRYAVDGIMLSPRSFFREFKRGGLTLVAALSACLMPPPLRRRVFVK